MSTPKSKITANAIVWTAKILLAIFTMTSITIGTTNESHTVVILMVLVAVCGVVFGYPLIYMVESHVGTVTDYDSFPKKSEKPFTVVMFACAIILIAHLSNLVDSYLLKVLIMTTASFLYYFGYKTTYIEED